MGLNPHDLIKIGSVQDLRSYTPIPDWVNLSLSKAPFVVVRRARAPEGLIAIGVRGSERNERYAAFLPVEKILFQITPEQLAYERRWKGNPKKINCYLSQVSEVLKNYPFRWGPTGSLGFEIASGIETTTTKSDIDIVIRSSSQLTVPIAKKLIKELEAIPVRIDVQVEEDIGAFSLNEYVRLEGKELLLRTLDGPKLTQVCF